MTHLMKLEAWIVAFVNMHPSLPCAKRVASESDRQQREELPGWIGTGPNSREENADGRTVVPPGGSENNWPVSVRYFHEVAGDKPNLRC